MNDFTNIREYHDHLLWVKVIKATPQFERAEGAVKLYSPNGVDYCWIDEEDADLTRYSWGNVNGYYSRYTSRRHPTHPYITLFLHRMILERVIGRPMEKDEYVDHADMDRRNNRRSNLRLASKAENAYNMKHRESKSSGVNYRGVSTSGRKYRAQVRYSVVLQETFEKQEDAARFHDEMVAKYHGQFAVFNFPNEWEFDESANQWRKTGAA